MVSQLAVQPEQPYQTVVTQVPVQWVLPKGTHGCWWLCPMVAGLQLCVCVCVCVCVCMRMHVSVCMCVCGVECVYVELSVCMCACVYVELSVWSVNTHVCMDEGAIKLCDMASCHLGVRHYQGIDLGLLHKGVQNVQDTMHVPDVCIVPKSVYLIWCPALQFTTELHKRLELCGCVGVCIMYACDWILTWYRNSSIMSHSHWFGSSISKGLSASGGKAVNGHSSGVWGCYSIPIISLNSLQ